MAQIRVELYHRPDMQNKCHNIRVSSKITAIQFNCNSSVSHKTIVHQYLKLFIIVNVRANNDFDRERSMEREMALDRNRIFFKKERIRTNEMGLFCTVIAVGRYRNVIFKMTRSGRKVMFNTL